MADSSSFGSNNPFRRKAPADSAAPPPPSTTPVVEPSSTSAFDDPSSLPAVDQFRSQLRSLPQSTQPPPKTSFQKPKVVKRVRVQSPPPSSPESAGAPDIFPKPGQSDDESSEDERNEVENQNPFGAPRESRPTTGAAEEPTTIQARPTLAQGPPPNPFQRTLSDIERAEAGGPQQGNASTGGKVALDVDAFRRLLLTGQAGVPTVGSPPNPSPPVAQTNPHLSTPGDGGSITDASSVSRQSIMDATHPQETPRTSHEISEPDAEDDRHGLISRPPAKKQGPPATLRKKPPPPSSRHGKLIKVEPKEAEKPREEGENVVKPLSSPSGSSSLSSPTGHRPSTPSDVNKPLPPAPERLDGVESVFDREAAGKVPEHDDLDAETADLPPPRPPTPPNASHATDSPPAPPQASRKPAPPPRRQPHGRSESRSVPASASATAVPTAAAQDENDPTPTRSSLESNRSRSSSLRVNIQGPGPAPPPPRRPNHGIRSQGSFTSPTAVSFTSLASNDSPRSPSDLERSPAVAQFSLMGEAAGPHTIALSPAASQSGKLAPPPPPPARNPSVRSNRPPSVSSFEGIARRVSREKEGSGAGGPPPPPPPRQRGSSKSSVEAPSLGQRRTSIDSVKFRSAVLAEEPDVGVLAEEEEASVPAEVSEPVLESDATNILADLDALRREVDALRGQYDRTGTDAP